MSTPQQNNLQVIEESPVTKPKMEPWKIKILLLGGVSGAVVGLLSAFLLINNSERRGIQPTMGPREGFKIAVLALGLVRSVSNLWED